MSFLIRARIDFQIPIPENANNAECAPESPAEPAGFILRTGSTACRRPREVISPHRLVRVEFEEAREDAEPVFDTSLRVPTPTPFPQKYTLKSRTPRHPDADNSTRKKPNSSFRIHSSLVSPRLRGPDHSFFSAARIPRRTGAAKSPGRPKKRRPR